nr:hypothetical protein [Tanacetum cinerariifolium]
DEDATFLCSSLRTLHHQTHATRHNTDMLYRLTLSADPATSSLPQPRCPPHGWRRRRCRPRRRCGQDYCRSCHRGSALDNGTMSRGGSDTEDDTEQDPSEDGNGLDFNNIEISAFINEKRASLVGPFA